MTNESAPWEWWDPNSPIAQTVIDPVSGATAHLVSLQSNPDMSPEKGLAYLDTIQGYLMPRVMCALDLPENWCEDVVGVEELTSAALEIYPNPTNGQVTIIAASQIDQMTIYNVVGEIVQNVSALQSSQIVVDLSKYPSGMYIVTAKTGDVVITERLIKE